MPYHDPGEYLTSKNRYAQMLMQGPNYNTGTTTGGLAHLLQQGLSGFMMGQDARDKRMASEALTRGMGAKPWVDPDTGESVGTAGGIEGALAALQGGVGGEYGDMTRRSLTMNLMMRRREDVQAAQARKLKLSDRDESRKYKADLADIERSEKLADRMEEREFKKEMKGIPQAAAPKERRIVKGADGRNYYSDTGDPVLPGVKTPQEKFMEMLAPPGELGGGSGDDILGGRLPLIGGQGVDELIGQSGGDILAGPKQQPTVRDIFFKLPPEVQTGIKMSQDPMKAFSAYLLKSKGLDIQFNDDGTIKSINQGGAGGAWSRKQTGTIQEKLFNAREGLARIQSIDEMARPEFQEIGFRFDQAWSALKESLGVDLSPEDKADLADFSVYKMSAIENINLYIKEITGAQMSEAEAVRLRKGQPDPGDAWYDGDSPTEFISKLGAQTRKLRMASARYVYALKNKWDMNPDNLSKALPLTKVEDLIEERGAALERQLRARRPDLSDGAIEGFVVQSLNAEFGIGQ